MEKDLHKDVDKCSLELVSLINISDLKENDVLFFRINNISPAMLGAFQSLNDRYGKIFRDKNVSIIAVKENDKIEKLDEKQMNEMGWFKKNQKRIITLS